MAEQTGGAAGHQVEGLRQRRLAELAQMADEQFAAEVRGHQAARWRSRRLASHARDHRPDLMQLLGRTLSPPELQALSHDIQRKWDRLFTEREPSGITYTFVRLLPRADAAIIVITRGGFVRSTFPTRSLSARLRRHPAAIEVTERAKRLGL